jgi:chromosome segregation ATPase
LIRDGSPKLPRKEVARAYLSNVNRQMKMRQVPKNFHQDPEGMYMDIQELKQDLKKATAENMKLKTQLMQVEAGRVRKQKQVEELLRAHAIVETKGTHYEHLFKEVNLVKKLKERVRDLEQILAEKDEEFERIKVDSRYTRVRELETELKAYYTESRRLQRIVEQTRSIQDGHEQTMMDMSRMGEENAKLRELVVNMKKVQDYYQVQLSSIAQKKEEMNNLMTTNQKYAAKKDALKKERTTLNQNLDGIQRELEALQDEHDNMKDKHEILQKENEAITKNHQTAMDLLHKENQKLAKSNVTLQNEKQSVEIEKTTYQQRITDLKGKMKAIKTTLDNETKEKIAAQHEMITLKYQVESLQKDKDSQQPTQSEPDPNSVQAQIKKFKTALKEKSAEVEHLQIEIEDLRKKMAEKDIQIKRYMTIIAQAKSAEEDDRQNHEQIVRLSRENAELLEKVMHMKHVDKELEDDTDNADEQTEYDDTETDTYKPTQRKYTFDDEEESKTKKKAGVLTYDEAATTIARAWRSKQSRMNKKTSKPNKTIADDLNTESGVKLHSSVHGGSKNRYDEFGGDDDYPGSHHQHDGDNTYDDDTYNDMDDTYDKYNNGYEDDNW